MQEVPEHDDQDDLEAKLTTELNRFCVTGGSQQMTTVDCIQFADRALEATSCVADDDRCVRIAAEAIRVAYNRGLLVALDELSARRGRGMTTDPEMLLTEISACLRAAMVPG